MILDGAASGAWNMAVDEALLVCHAADAAPPTVRFYDWQPACVSVGRLQKLSDESGLNGAAIRERGFDIVRRPTGGRAVLHQHEITYSILIRMDFLPAGCRSVIGSYRWLSEGFAAGLRALGIDATLAPSSVDAAPGIANCFSSAAQCDFLVAERKLIGAAQLRRNGAILQHGSLLLEVDVAAWQDVFGGSMERAASLRELGVTAARPAIIQALCSGLERAWQAGLQPGVLQAQEIGVASRLHTEKYAAGRWDCAGLERLLCS
ncbi:MAG TPA: lipoate--protein ligase family protein [Abditibacteriaceae bacterium]|nr:lipoate--protein ligase family protein [Abditibacteriaceae bacterium]